MRLFSAIAFSFCDKEKIAEYCKTLSQHGISGNITNTQNFHLTLKFLGEVDSKKLPLIKTALDKAASEISHFVLQSESVGSFASRGDRTVYLLMNSPTLPALAKAVDKSFAEIGFTPETRDFVAHITLMRRSKATNEELSKIIPPLTLSANVDSITLYESRRDMGRLVYKPLYVSKLL